ncbi:MAG TPA: hypothetical protein VMF53_03185 [Alphaproteobacteria bacterium]|nr:hypothetical protein [Alphaproteobacteria bacterium]
MKLKPPEGCAAVSIGGVTYALDSDGLIDVPEAQAEMLLQSHGFTELAATEPQAAAEPAAQAPAMPESKPESQRATKPAPKSAPKPAPKRALAPGTKSRARKE